VSETPFRLLNEVKFECGSLIIGWSEDTGRLGPGVTNYLKSHLKFRPLAEIEPTGFFSLGGVAVEDDIARFPEGNLFYCAEKELLLFQSTSPQSEWYKYLNTIIDMAQFHCRLNEIYTVGGMIVLGTHYQPRQLMSVSNGTVMRKVFNRLSMELTMNYETPEGQRPTLNSYLIWVARQRGIPAASMWVPVPFYMTTVSDPQAWRKALEFFDKRFELGLNFNDLDSKITTQNDKLNRARADISDMDAFLKRLEENQMLTQEENTQLVKSIESVLGKNEGLE
jgi:predicted ATP-grasp superfamily ATP-dependent carboligase